MQKKNIIAMLLAGGQGSRLGPLTRKIAKPAVAFGGKYRIIDFALSNCSNSGIDTVGVLTQYKPQILNSHIGIGAPWDLDRIHGGVAILPPYMGEGGGDWYKGTANAVYQNINFMDQFDPDYVLILSGDHIYKMDYRKMLAYHIEHAADGTIAVIKVPLDEAPRFGIMDTDETGRITEFEEKPTRPKSTLASMGIYIFSYKKLKEYITEDEADPNSNYDFGKNVIPAMLAAGEQMYAYQFNGYWKDVGTIESYWESNMDCVRVDNELKLFDNSWKLYTETGVWPAQYVGSEAKVSNAVISEGCVILGEIINSIIFPGVYISKNTKIMNSIIMQDCKIGENVLIDKSILMENVTVMRNNVIGNSVDITVIDDNKVMESNSHSGV
ncbi:MAG: glucose-1-phosphate adenylyltransferase [Clostridiales bacterium]|jgi:glucose-1-phosphate adenylyltransferase|nr:glucose-1-phosphate adenylyltransferase [Clostridiales bacterium]